MRINSDSASGGIDRENDLTLFYISIQSLRVLMLTFLFKSEATSFPMRIDVGADWWREYIGHDTEQEGLLRGGVMEDPEQLHISEI